MNAFQTLINGDTPVLIDFFATWCGPCKMMAPILDDVKTELGDSVTIIKIDVDKNQALVATSQFQVRGVPTLMLFKNGEMLWKQSGVVPKEDLVKTVKSFQ
ncbi:thioredoxin [Flavobacterium psychrotrophum]|uniref:thioredoxin n=1 Tax=Flavobacterium psychrotrophum TaxID=2294119 RepID=UPI000E31BDA3|nr:thioredoxin [Flavobacterium psychrotrophum]